MLALARSMTTKVNLNMVPRVNVVKSNMTSRFRDFVRMNPLMFLGSKVGDDPQKIFDCVYMMLSAMGVTYRDKVELCSYQLRNVSRIWYTQ